MKKIAIYCRVSTALQEQEKTVESQLSELREICKGFEITKEYIDDGWSGANLMRPELDKMRDDAKNKMFEALYVISTDRLSRNLYHQGILVEELKKHNIEIFIKDKPIADTPDGKFMFNILGAVNEYEKERILERTMRGRFYKARTKQIVGGIPPYGYKYIKRTDEKAEHYEINEKETEVVRLIFDLYIESKSINFILGELAKRNILPRKGGLKWDKSSISVILRNSAYIGKGFYNKNQFIEVASANKYKKNIKNSKRRRDKSEWIPVPHPVILDESKFYTAQDMLSKRYKPFGATKYFYLLSGLIRCAKCDSTFTGEKNNNSKESFYYRCNNRQRKYPLANDCNVPCIRTKDLDTRVWDTVSEVITDQDILAKHISLLTENITKSEDELTKDKEVLIKKQTDIIQKRNKLIEIYTGGEITKEQFTERNDGYNSDEEAIKNKIARTDALLNKVITKPMIMEKLNVFCSAIRDRLKNLDIGQKRDFLRDVLEKIIFDSVKREANIIGYANIDENTLMALNNRASVEVFQRYKFKIHKTT